MPRKYKQDHKINNKGFNNPNSKITAEQMQEIIRLREVRGLSHRAIALQMNCSHTQVRRILNKSSQDNV